MKIQTKFERGKLVRVYTRSMPILRFHINGAKEPGSLVADKIDENGDFLLLTDDKGRKIGEVDKRTLSYWHIGEDDKF